VPDVGTIAARVTLVVSAVCIVAGVLALYARAEILDPGRFGDRAVGTLAQDEVADEIASRVATKLIERSPGLVTLRPALEAAALDVEGTDWFAAELGAGMRRVHRAVFSGGDPRPALVVPGMAYEVRAAVGRRDRRCSRHGRR